MLLGVMLFFDGVLHQQDNNLLVGFSACQRLSHLVTACQQAGKTLQAQQERQDDKLLKIF
jgi:hypothetical protein